ncbi:MULTISPECIES: alanine racemase [unclassified Paludibacterium]|uniref:alanine racemase n=1 Tax=unclassified Paludibacterium TaxID=2618429 RepID=UPI001C058BA7|nr:alanine racemase [Paludibacterium sp. B53371]BEV73378.1 catabolic alanine racemase DadX [Paludibacterium sp. THUN1379]
MTRPIRVEINLSAIKHNYRHSRHQAPGSQAYAVIKANAYGHGAMEVATALAEEADGFAMLNLEDALALRKAGIRQPLALLEGPFEKQETILMAAHGIAGAIHSEHQLAWLADAHFRHGQFDAWLKVNSGMNRLGFQPRQVRLALQQLRNMPDVQLSTIMTHFASADDERGVADQWQRFEPIARESGLAVSAANSAAVFHHPHTHCDRVRPGITLYGCSPFEGQTGRDLGLIPAMTLSADIIAVQYLQPGDNVGYGCRFTADKPMRIGIVACGYADGYPRIAPNGTPVSIDGIRSGTVGRVSMDMLAVDISHIEQAGVGSRVVLWGEDIPLENVAAAVGTLAYELMCGVTLRVPKIYV